MNPWICPKCGRVFGPLVMECHYCNAPQINSSSTSIYYYEQCNHEWDSYSDTTGSYSVCKKCGMKVNVKYTGYGFD
jgi:ribosomal protein L37AE/L43A